MSKLETFEDYEAKPFFIDGSKPMTTSLALASSLKREHKSILRSIRELIEIMPEEHRCKVVPTYVNDVQGKRRLIYKLDEYSCYQLLGSLIGLKGYEFRHLFWVKFKELEAQAKTMESQLKLLEGGKSRRDPRHSFAYYETKIASPGCADFRYVEGKKPLKDMDEIERHSYLGNKLAKQMLGCFDALINLGGAYLTPKSEKILKLKNELADFVRPMFVPKLEKRPKQKLLFPEHEAKESNDRLEANV